MFDKGQVPRKQRLSLSRLSVSLSVDTHYHIKRSRRGQFTCVCLCVWCVCVVCCVLCCVCGVVVHRSTGVHTCNSKMPHQRRQEECRKKNPKQKKGDGKENHQQKSHLIANLRLQEIKWDLLTA